MTITIKQLAPRSWHIDVAGVLPDGSEYRKRTTQALPSRAQAREYGEGIWKAALGGSLRKAAPPTIEEYAQTWLAARTARGLSSAVTNKYELARLMPKLGSTRLDRVTRSEIAAAVKQLEQTGELRRGTGKISPRSVRHSYTTLRTMLADAVIDGHINVNPASLRAHRDEIPTVRDKDPLWRRQAKFTPPEVQQLISDERISAPERVAYALESLAGLRFGEASALRWSSWDPDAEPLGRLSIHEAYDSNNDRLKGVKTQTSREVPVHPDLALVFEDWWAAGWKRAYGRAPRAGDLVIPIKDGKTFRHRHKLDNHRLHVLALETLGLRHRRQHDLRRTFVTLCIAGGANKDLLKWASHGPPRSTMIDEYTSPPWETLCAQVMCLSLAPLAHSWQS